MSESPETVEAHEPNEDNVPYKDEEPQQSENSSQDTELQGVEAQDTGSPEEQQSVDDSDPLAVLEVQIAERTEDLQRVTAEYSNYRRRVERDRVSIVEGAKADVAAKLLPLVDDLELAESHGDLEGPLKALHSKLVGVLDSVNVSTFAVEGEEFDPDLHEAVQDTSTGEDKVLGTVLRKGYRMGDRVIRTAMVIIADPR